MPLLSSLGLVSLALAALSGWLVLAVTERPDWFRSHGVPRRPASARRTWTG